MIRPRDHVAQVLQDRRHEGKHVALCHRRQRVCSESRPRVVDVFWRTGAVSGGWYRVDASVLTHMWVLKSFRHELGSLVGGSPVLQVLIVRGDGAGRMNVEVTLGIQGRERLLVPDLHVRLLELLLHCRVAEDLVEKHTA